MGLFSKVLASVGVGNAQIDTKLEKDTFVQGEEVRGVIEVRGGAVEQNIDALYLTLHNTFIQEYNDHKTTNTANIDRFLLTERFMINPNEFKQIPFSFTLSLDTPITFGKTKVWIATGAEIKNGVDPTDNDFIKVHPSHLVASIMNTMEELGFALSEAICEATTSHYRGRLPFVQELEYTPTHGDFYRRLDEVEIIILGQSSEQVELVIEVDRRARVGSLTSFLAEAMDMDEIKTRLTLTTNDIPNMTNKLFNIINAYY